jgi:hypothetical protein
VRDDPILPKERDPSSPHKATGSLCGEMMGPFLLAGLDRVHKTSTVYLTRHRDGSRDFVVRLQFVTCVAKPKFDTFIYFYAKLSEVCIDYKIHCKKTRKTSAYLSLLYDINLVIR